MKHVKMDMLKFVQLLTLLLFISGGKAMTPYFSETDTVYFVENGRPVNVISTTDDMRSEKGVLFLSGTETALFAKPTLDEGDFHIRVTLTLDEIAETGAALFLGGDFHTGPPRIHGRYSMEIYLDGPNDMMQINARGIKPVRLFGDDTVITLGKASEYITLGVPVQIDLVRSGNRFIIRMNNEQLFERESESGFLGYFGIMPGKGQIQVQDFWATGTMPVPVIPHKTLWQVGDEGYICYRIPSVITTRKGTVLVFAEARKSGPGKGDTDIVMKYSQDNAQTWSEQIMLWNPGTEAYFVRDPCPVQDQTTGDIYLLMDSNWHARDTKPGTQRIYFMRSSDDGSSWSAPEPVIFNHPSEDLKGLNMSPAFGIQLMRPPYRGRLVAPAIRRTRDGKVSSCVIYSDDHGKSWNMGSAAAPGTNECTIVELDNGDILLNMRSLEQYRTIAMSSDGGKTFLPARRHPELPDPVCHANILRYSGVNKEFQENNLILFSNPATEGGRLPYRFNMTVRSSFDNGMTWPVQRLVYAGYSAYSSMTVLPDGRIGLIYEQDDYRQISFTAFPVNTFVEPTFFKGKRQNE